MTGIPAATATGTSTPDGTDTPAATATDTLAATATATPTPTTKTATATPTPTATKTPKMTATATLTLTATETPTATPTPSPQFELLLKRIGQGSVFAQSPGPYSLNQSVVVAASADPGWQFVGWTCDVDSQGNPLSLIITAPLTITAHFQQVVPPPPPPTDPYTLLLLSMAGGDFIGNIRFRTKISLPTTGQLANGHSSSTAPMLGSRAPMLTRWRSQARVLSY